MGRTVKLGFVAAAAAALAGLLFAPPLGITQTEPDLREHVTVEAKSEVQVPPDIARVSLGVVTRANSAAAAAAELSDRTNAVLDALRAAGFSDEQLTVRDARVDDRRDRDSGVVTYTGSTSVVVETTDLDQVGEIIDIGVTSGANNVRGVSFDIENDSEAIKQALRQAMGFAIEKADVLAQTAGRTRGRALTISEGYTRYGGADFAGGEALGRRAGSVGSRPFPIIPPDLTVRARVVVSFALQ